MSKYNTKIEKETFENRAGGKAYKQTDKLAITSQLLTSFVKSQFYRDENEGLKDFIKLINDIEDKKFIAKAAIYARNTFGMRSITHITAGELAKLVKGEKWTKSFYDKVVFRVDDILEILSYYQTKYKKPFPNSLKKGLRISFNKFNNYELSKYKGEGKKIKLVDAVNLLHPIPTANNTYALEKLINGKLINTQTWETKLTQAGQKATDEENLNLLKTEAWKDLIINNKLGYFALLRNINNIIALADEDTIKLALKQLINPIAIEKSLVLPFRFTTAIEHIKTNRKDVATALNTALELSLKNVPKFEGKTLIAIDSSGSMMGQPQNISTLFGSVLYKSNNSDVLIFSDIGRYVKLNPQDTISTIKNNIPFIAAGTDFNVIFDKADKKYDRIIILSDMQGWIGHNTPEASFKKYCDKYKCNPYIYSFDLTGYGDMQFKEDKMFCLAGFSNNIFKIMEMLEKDKNALLNEIEKIEL